MSEYENSELDIHEPVAFGQQLMLAREKAGMTIEEAARALNLKEEIVEAIEDSAMHKLPPVAFVQGYVRTYARLLGLPEDRILREFEQEVPHELESELHPRPPSPDGATSQTPAIKLVTVVIILLAVVVLVYAVYSYYTERTESIEQASRAEEAAMQLPPEAPLVEPQTATIEPSPGAEDAAAPLLEPVVTPAATEAAADAEPAAEAVAETEMEAAIAAPPPLEEEPAAADVLPVESATAPGADTGIESIMPVPEPKPITGGDVMLLSAEQDCWAEIVDANDIRMFYGTIQPGRDLRLTGQAPFDVFLGNAPAVTMSLNSIAIDMTKYIRSNNIAQFKLSVEDGRARFH